MVDITKLLAQSNHWSSIAWWSGLASVVLAVLNLLLFCRLFRHSPGIRTARSFSTVLVVVATGCQFWTSSEAGSRSWRVVGELQKEAAPRLLGIEKERALSAVFARFQGNEVYIGSYIGDIEGTSLARQIVRAHVNSGNIIDDSLGKLSYHKVTVGLVVDGTNADFVDAVTEVLSSANLGPVTSRWPAFFIGGDKADSTSPLRIFIGVKPLPPTAP